MASLSISGALVVGLMAAAPPAAIAATSTVEITKSGYVPKDTTIVVGDTVSFTNSDSAAHEVTLKPTTGVKCSVTPLVVQPGASQTCTFESTGNFSLSDPNSRGNTFKGSITVKDVPTVSGSVSLAPSRSPVIYGSQVTLTGKVSPAKGGVTVDIMAKPYPEQAFVKVASVATEADGSFRYAEPPRTRTDYMAQFTDGTTKGTSSAVVVTVRPKVTLVTRSVRSGKATFKTGVVSSASYAGKYVLLQRRNSAGGWTTVKKIKLGEFSSRVFSVRIPSGRSKWRTYLQVTMAGAGYVASWSPTRTVRR
jgi:plastocyanin